MTFTVLPTPYAHRLIGLCKNRYQDHSDGGLEIHHVCRNRACINPDHLHSIPPNEHKQIHVRIGDDHPVTSELFGSVSANDNYVAKHTSGSRIYIEVQTSTT